VQFFDSFVLTSGARRRTTATLPATKKKVSRKNAVMRFHGLGYSSAFQFRAAGVAV
jgi:hypothetical protein